MISPEIVARINELYKKQKEAELNQAEKEEQAKLRRMYIDDAKQQVKDQLGLP